MLPEWPPGFKPGPTHYECARFPQRKKCGVSARCDTAVGRGVKCPFCPISATI